MFRRATMKISAVCLPILCTLLGGCDSGAVLQARAVSATGSQRAAQVSRPAWWRDAPALVKHGVYVSQVNGAGTTVLFGFGAQDRKNHPAACSMPGPAYVDGIGSDASGNIYLPSIAAGSVSVYAPDCGNLIGAFSDPFGDPVGAVVRGTAIYLPNGNGNVAVCTMSGCASELTDPSILQMTSAAVDSHGDVWASYYDQRTAIQLIVWRHGMMPGHIVNGYVTNPVPGGLIFDKNDALIAIAFGNAFTYSCSARTASCTNTGTIGLQGGSNYAALNPANTSIQVTDFSHTSVDVYSYPGFTYLYSYDRGLDTGSSVIGITLTTVPN